MTPTPTDSEMARSRAIVQAMLSWRYIEMGLQHGEAPDLSVYSLRDLLNANRMVSEHGTVTHDDGTQTVPMKCADSLIAALYAACRYPAHEPDACVSIVSGRGKALVCVKV